MSITSTSCSGFSGEICGSSERGRADSTSAVVFPAFSGWFVSTGKLKRTCFLGLPLGDSGGIRHELNDRGLNRLLAAVLRT
jgi:hypothetical protein